MPRIKYHVTPTRDGDWRVKGTGAQRADSVHDNKSEAVDRGRELAKQHQLGQLIIHKKDRTIEKEHTYGKDPRKYPS